MCMFGAPKAPPPVQIPETPPAPAAAPQASDPAAMAKTQAQKRARLAQGGANDTLVTGGGGLTAPANTASKSLFGQ